MPKISCRQPVCCALIKDYHESACEFQNVQEMFLYLQKFLKCQSFFPDLLDIGGGGDLLGVGGGEGTSAEEKALLDGTHDHEGHRPYRGPNLRDYIIN